MFRYLLVSISLVICLQAEEFEGKILTGTSKGSKAEKILISVGDWNYLGTATSSGLCLDRRVTKDKDGTAISEAILGDVVSADKREPVIAANGLATGANVLLIVKKVLETQAEGRVMTGFMAGSEAGTPVPIEVGSWRYIGKVTDVGLVLVSRSTVAADGKTTDEKVDGTAVLADSEAAITLAKGVKGGAKVIVITTH